MKPTILVADEGRFWREATRDALEARGYPVACLDNYADLPRVLAQGPDVALLGFTVVNHRSEELVAETRVACPGTAVVVLSTSWPVPLSAEARLLQLGAADVVGRPVNDHELANLVEGELRAHHRHLNSLSSYARFRLQGAPL